jgi:formylglycine-generating enzyme required for sulfatase activity/tetratricopeptide (TPR) repeat protein
MYARMVFFAALVAVLLNAPAHAELSEWWRSCTGKPDVDWEQQIESCTSIIESNQEAPERLAVAYNNRGVARLELTTGRTVLPDDRAMADFGEAIKLNPKYADAYYNRGRLWHVNGVYWNAIDLYTYAIGLDPKHVGAYRHRGLAWLLTGQTERAIADFDEAIRLDPNDAGVYRDRGYARFRKDDVDGAVADFTEAIRRDRKLVDAYTGRGKALLIRDEFDRAVADYSEAIQLDPSNINHHVERGYANFLRGDFSASAADLHRALNLDRYDYREQDLILFRYLARSRAGQEARVELEEARPSYNTDPAFDLYLGDAPPGKTLKLASSTKARCRAAFYIGQWYLLRGDRAEARRHLQSAALDQCNQAIPHHHAAAVELKRFTPADDARPRAEEPARPDPALSIVPGSGKAFRDTMADGQPCPMCPEMVVVPAGSFTMGSPESEPDREPNEGPQHTVTFAQNFAVGRFALTFDEWDACVADGGCNGYRPSDNDWGREQRPVIHVEWGDAKDYVAWLSRKTGRTYRLLSEAEREYVTRAGTTTPFWWGGSVSKKQANYQDKKTVPVDTFQPNPWGLYQVHGNVSEWVEDCPHDNYNGAPTDGSAWRSIDCSERVLRGGSWLFGSESLRSASRHSSGADSKNDSIGFRVGRTLIP